MSFSEIPEGWITDKLGNLIDISIGKTPKRSESRYWQNGTHKWATIASLEFGKELTETAEYVTDTALKETKIKKVPKGTLLFSFKLTIGKMAFAGCDLYTNEAIAALTPKNSRIDKKLLFYALQVANLTINAGDAAKGTTLNTKTIPLIEVAFPKDIKEQHRIVARIEELTSRTEEARKLRQETVKEISDTMTAYIDRLLYDLPKDCWKPIGTCAKLQGGYAFKSEWFSEGGMRLLRNQNIYHDEIDWSEDKTVYLPNSIVHEFDRFALSEGDIVLTMDRPLIKSGLKASRIRQKDLPCLLLQRVGRFLCSDEISKDYLFQCLLSQVFTSQISGSERSNAVPHISSKQVEGISIPIPSVDVQLEIVKMAEKFSRKISLIGSLQQETSNALEAFQSSLLVKAFRGEL